ncbi:MAG: hypothetical protein CL779_02080 [Chloroflexi bacterium]|nr:hypothetical protein [Chloroflexota bacterium]|tara:strand:+ start:12284 stop:13210 length:927 start_codon:yes stop_codon:yes gene_type:complete
MKKLFNYIDPRKYIRFFKKLLSKINLIQEALGRIEARQINDSDLTISDSEFRVFSQWGEDGIIQYLINKIEIKNKVFVEFGVENYLQSNTRFLLVNNYWSGLVIDGNRSDIDYLKQDQIYWAHNIKAENAFITKKNIESILSDSGIDPDLGILSIDIDGNDYWIWESIESFHPRIVICEYNSIFGPDAKVTTCYRNDFTRHSEHHSGVLYGASIKALDDLAKRKGYCLVAGNTAGNNIFFVRNDLLSNLTVLSPQEAYQKANFREYKDKNGKLTFDNFEERLRNIQNEEIFDIDLQKNVKVKEVIEIP